MTGLPGGAPLTPTALLEPPEPDLGLVERAAVEEDVPHGLLEAGPLLRLERAAQAQRQDHQQHDRQEDDRQHPAATAPR